MNLEFLDNAHTRVWIEDGDSRTYCGRTAVFRVLFEHGKVTILLCENLTKNPFSDSDLLRNFSNGSDLLITYVEVGRPDAFENNDILLTFYNCQLRRSWIPKMTILQASDADLVKFFVQLEAPGYRWKNDEKHIK